MNFGVWVPRRRLKDQKRTVRVPGVQYCGLGFVISGLILGFKASKFGVSSSKFGVLNMKFGVWVPKIGVWTLKSAHHACQGFTIRRLNTPLRQQA